MTTRAEGLLTLIREVLASAGEAEAELYLRVAERGCARFAIGELGQHMQLAEPLAVVRVARGARVAETVTSRLDRDALIDAVRATGRAATLVPEVDAFPGFTRGDAPAVLHARRAGHVEDRRGGRQHAARRRLLAASRNRRAPASTS